MGIIAPKITGVWTAPRSSWRETVEASAPLRPPKVKYPTASHTRTAGANVQGFRCAAARFPMEGSTPARPAPATMPAR